MIMVIIVSSYYQPTGILIHVLCLSIIILRLLCISLRFLYHTLSILMLVVVICVNLVFLFFFFLIHLFIRILLLIMFIRVSQIFGFRLFRKGLRTDHVYAYCPRLTLIDIGPRSSGQTARPQVLRTFPSILPLTFPIATIIAMVTWIFGRANVTLFL